MPQKVTEVVLSKNNKKATRQTMKIMWDLALFGCKIPEIISLSREIVFHLPNNNNKKAFAGEVKAVFDFVKNNIRYTRDIQNIETLQSPEWTLHYMQGDCDDFAILIASLLLCLDHQVQFVAIALPEQSGGKFCHVFTETLIGRQWVALDATVPDKPMGYVHPNAIRLVASK